MRVAINCRSFLKKQFAGIGRYAYHLVQSLSEIDQENEYSLYVQKGLFDFKRKAPRIKADNFKVKIDRFDRGLNKTLGNVDIYHSPSPDFIDIDHARIIVTIHDLIYKTYPEGHTQETRELTQKQLNSIIPKTTRFICCSQSTAEDFMKYFSIDRKKISLIYQGVDHNMFYPLEGETRKEAQEIIRMKGVSGRFLLFVGTIEPRKNLKNLLYAFSLLRYKGKFQGQLVVAGLKGWMSDDIATIIGRLGIKNDVVFLGYLSNEELCCFYNLAEVFVFPSFYEGFGFPIVEAFCCAAPVVTSNVSSCPEVAGDAALMVDPGSPDQIADAIAQIVNNQDLRQVLKEKGLQRGKEFSFTKTARETLEVYKEVFKE